MCLVPYGILLYKKFKFFALLYEASPCDFLLLAPSSKLYSCFRVLVFLFQNEKIIWVTVYQDPYQPYWPLVGSIQIMVKINHVVLLISL